MSVRASVRPVATPADLALLGMLVAEPDLALADPPLHVPNAQGQLLALLLLSSETSKDSRQ